VPIDDDVRPFSLLNPEGGDTNRNNRRHHFISAVARLLFGDFLSRLSIFSSFLAKPHPHHTLKALRRVVVAFISHHHASTMI